MVELSAFGSPGASSGPACWTYDHLALPLPEQHRYPRTRLRLVREALIAADIVSPQRLTRSAPLEWDVLELVHTGEYLGRLRSGTLPRAQQLELGLPFSEELLTRARATACGTVQAALTALNEGYAANLGGGNHHGFADRPSGYCLFNDLAVAIRVLQSTYAAGRFAVIDLDVHQGNGTAEIFARDPDVFTFSMHAASNWPFAKAKSDLDIALPDGTGDAEYLEALDRPLAAILERFRPDVVFYQAGVDPLYSDRLGRLALTHDGLRMRDERVLQACYAAGAPVVVTLGGGYGRPIEDSVQAHVNTLRALRDTFSEPRP
jgi:acetoin utilization deacetylase AcuC-like enzyme